jgi:acetate kinase
LDTERIFNALLNESGLLGVSGVSPNIADIEAAAKQGNARAQLALDMFADRVRSAIGSLAATMGGVDVVLFTDRVGENSPAVRAMICERLEFLGIHIDAQRNATAKLDCDISVADSPVRILAIRTREEWMIAREAYRVVNAMRKNGKP